MFDIILNTAAQTVKFGALALSFVLWQFSILYLMLYFVKHFSIQKALLQMFPIIVLLFMNLAAEDLITKLQNYSQSQLSGLILNYNLKLYKTEGFSLKDSKQYTQLGTIDCNKLTFKECVLKIKDNKAEIINYLESNSNKKWSF
jgi:hypothetical protein